MKEFYLIILSIFVSISAGAQQSEKYLEGAVPEEEGKVVFSRIIPVREKITDEKLYELMNKWANERFVSKDKLNSRVLFSNPETKDIACQVEDYLVFQSSAFSLDRAKMIYRLIVHVRDNKCDVTIRNVKYDYSEEKKLIPAEEKITDKYALNKQKDKLNRNYDKFRIQTIDSVNSLFNSIDVYLNGENKSTRGAVASAVSIPTMSEKPITVLQNNLDKKPSIDIAQSVVDRKDKVSVDKNGMIGFKSISADKIPGNIIKLLSDAMLIISGKPDNINVMAASWGGLGRFWEMPVAFCFLNPTRYSIKTMDTGDTYTLSFYTEAYRDAVLYCGSVSGLDTDKIKGSGLSLIETPSGAYTFSEAWLIIECKKLVSQQLTSDSIAPRKLPDDWTKNGLHKMYIGEILNVWIK